MQQRRDFLKHAAAPVALAAMNPWAAWAQNTSLPLEQVKIVNGFDGFTDSFGIRAMSDFQRTQH